MLFLHRMLSVRYLNHPFERKGLYLGGNQDGEFLIPGNQAPTLDLQLYSLLTFIL